MVQKAKFALQYKKIVTEWINLDFRCDYYIQIGKILLDSLRIRTED